LLIVLRSAIGLQAPGTSYASLPGLRNTTVRACRNLVGWYPTFQQAVASPATAITSGAPISFSKLLGIVSLPRALLALLVRIIAAISSGDTTASMSRVFGGKVSSLKVVCSMSVRSHRPVGRIAL
jgi:hypothetical protein